MLVAGAPPLILEAVRRVLVDQGFTVVNAEHEAEPRPAVAVLIDPTPVHWAQARSRGASIVLVSGHPMTIDASTDAVFLGADAVLNLDASPALLTDAVRAAGSERARLDSGQVRAVIARARDEVVRPVVELTSRQRQILELAEAGLSLKQTARELDITPKTVENHQRALFQKLGVKNRAEAIVTAHALGLIGRAERPAAP